jgi:transposase InsO family protein
MFLWSQRTGVRLIFIQLDKSRQNGLSEISNDKLGDEYLNEHWITSLEEARKIIREFKIHYNKKRPHSVLDYKTPNKLGEANSVLGDCVKKPILKVSPELTSIKKALLLTCI